jgi:ubiquinone biosynthesis accessory factor UbiJ
MRTNTTSPFNFLQSLAARFQPPAWVVDEGQQKLVLFLNHVLMQEKEAQNRLLRKKGSVVHVRWGVFALDLLITPAGLLDRAAPGAKPDLLLAVAAESPAVVMQSVLAGKAPPVKIEGDVQLAAEINWLADNLRWDVEEDLSRIIGDVPAHTLAGFARQAMAGLRQFLAQAPGSTSSSSSSGAVTVPPVPEPPKAGS